jgi:hypothetical protein
MFNYQPMLSDGLVYPCCVVQKIETLKLKIKKNLRNDQITNELF